MSNEGGGKPPEIKPISNGRIDDRFFQKELLPLSSEEAVLGMVLRVVEQLERKSQDRETGAIQKWPPQTKIELAGGFDILLKGVGYKDLPPVGEFALFQVEQVKNDFGTKVFLKKWRAVEDVRSLTDFRPVATPLRFARQLVCSTTQGADYLRMPDDIITTVEEAERLAA